MLFTYSICTFAKCCGMPLVIRIPCRRAIARLFGRRTRNLATATLYGSRTPRDATGDSTPVRVARVDKKHRLLQHQFLFHHVATSNRSAACTRPVLRTIVVRVGLRESIRCCPCSLSTFAWCMLRRMCSVSLVVHLSRIRMSPMLRHAACCPLVYYSRVTSVAACCLLST